MKQLIITICLLVATQADLVAQQLKLGHIDRQELMLSLPERKEAETKMQSFAKQLDDRLKAMATEYSQKLAAAQAREAEMTKTEKESVLNELADLEERIQKAQAKAQEDLAKQEEELLQPMVERTNKAIDDVAREKGYTYVFDSSAGIVLFSGNGDNIMPLVKTKLGL